MRVLHLIDPGSPGGGACTLRLLAEPLRRLSGVDQHVLVIGAKQHVALARRNGVEPGGAICPPLNLAAFAWRETRRLLRCWESQFGRYDIIHAWTTGTAALTALAAPDRVKLATLSIGPVGAERSPWLPALLNRAGTPLLATSRGVRREFTAIGVAPSDISVLRPGIDPQALETAGGKSRTGSEPSSIGRRALRARWKVDDRSIMIAALSEPARWTDAFAAARVMSMAAESGRDVRLLIHPFAERRSEALRWARKLGLERRLVIESDLAEPWRIVNGLDVAILLGGTMNVGEPGGEGVSRRMGMGARGRRPMPGVMPLLWAMAAGVPVVAEAGEAVTGIIEEGVTGLLVKQSDPQAAAERLVRLYDHRTLAARIGAAARDVAHQHHHVAAFCDRLKEAYTRLVEGMPIQVLNRPAIEQVEPVTAMGVER